MIDSLEAIARILGLGRPRRLSFLIKLDAWLVRRHPLIWQTRVHIVLWWALWATPVGFGAGWLYVGFTLGRDAASVLTLQQQAAVNGLLGLAMLLVGALWSALAGQYMVRQFRVRQSLTLVALGLLAVLVTLAPAIAAAAGQSLHVARSLPEVQYRADIELHQEHGFWLCGGAADELAVQRDADAVRRSLRRFGVVWDGTKRSESDAWVSVFGCNVVAPHLNLGTLDNDWDFSGAVRVLTGRVELLEHCYSVWSEGFVRALWRTASDFGLHLLAAPIIALLITFATGAISRFVDRLRALSLPRIQLRLPAWLAVRSRRRLLNDPLWWAARPWRMTFWTAILAGSLLWGMMGRSVATAWVSCFVASGAIATVCGVRQAVSAGPPQLRLVTALFTAALWPAMFIGIVRLWASDFDDDASVYAISLVASSVFLAAALTVRALLSRLAAALAVCIAVGVTGLPIPLAPLITSMTSRDTSYALAYASGFAIWCWLASVIRRSQRNDSPPRGFFAAIIVTTMPAAAFFASLAVAFLTVNAVSSSSVAFALLVVGALGAAIVAGVFAWRPALRTLVQASQHPKTR